MRNLKKTNSPGKSLSVWPALLVLAAVSMAGDFVAAAPVAFDSLLPADTVIFVSLADYPEFAAKFKASPYHNMLSEPEVEAFVERLIDKVAEEAAELQEAYEQLGITPADLDRLLSGEVCIAIGEVRFEGERPEGFLAADVTGQRELAQEMVDKILQALQPQFDEQGITKTEESFHGKTIFRLAPSEEDEKAIYYMLDDEVLAAAVGGRSMLEKFIVMQTDDGLPSLAQSPHYKRIQARLGADEDMVVYVSISHMTDQIPSAPPAEPGQMPTAGVREWLDALGLMDVQAAAVGLKMMEGGSRSQGLVLVPAPRRGILKAFEPEYFDLEPPAFVAKDASLYSAFYFDLPTLWGEIMTALQTLNPMVYQMLQMQMNNPQFGLDVQNDIINALGNRWIGYQPAEAVTANPPVMINRAFTVQLKKSEAFQAAFQSLLAMTPIGGLSPVDYEGHTIYQFAAISMDPEMPGVEPTVAFMDDTMIIAFNLALAKSIIRDSRGERSPLLDNEDFQRGRDQVLSDAHMMAYADGRTSGERQWQTAKDALETEMGLQLPGWDVLRKYQAVSLTTGKWIQDGLLLKAWQPFPAGTE